MRIDTLSVYHTVRGWVKRGVRDEKPNHLPIFYNLQLIVWH